MTHFDYRCRTCGTQVSQIPGHIGHPPLVRCPNYPATCACADPMERYFGATRALSLNLGFRESRYATQTDADIAKFQFQHL